MSFVLGKNDLLHFRTALSVRQRSTRQDDLVLPRVKAESGKRRFVYRAARAYNALSRDLREARIAPFRRQIKKQLSVARR